MKMLRKILSCGLCVFSLFIYAKQATSVFQIQTKVSTTSGVNIENAVNGVTYNNAETTTISVPIKIVLNSPGITLGFSSQNKGSSSGMGLMALYGATPPFSEGKNALSYSLKLPLGAASSIPPGGKCPKSGSGASNWQGYQTLQPSTLSNTATYNICIEVPAGQDTNLKAGAYVDSLNAVIQY